jgi:phosphoglycolate phosphatase-like HAD superfamily hydrolase
MQPTVLLFDIDGTLVTTGPSPRKAIDRAFHAAYGKEGAFDFPFDGMTDRAIVRRALAGIGAAASEEAIDAFLLRYVELLHQELEAEPAYPLHHGMERALEVALAADGVAVGLGTGNIKAGARAKLDKIGLFDHFSFGGFGCDHELRPELIRIGAERGAQALGVPLASCRVVVIGDTPADVEAALAIGAACIGVGTGRYDPAQLLACGATHAFQDFRDPRALVALLGEGHGQVVRAKSPPPR